MAKRLPTASDACGNTTYGVPLKNNEGQYVAKMDYQLHNNHSMFVRYFAYPFKAAVATDLTNNALAGLANPLNPYGPDQYFVGGAGTAFSQLFGRNFPSYSAGFQFNIPLRNRAAQADYAMDQLKLRTEELQLQRSLNQIRVEVKNAVIGLQQARVRYETAVNTRALAEQSLDAEQKRFQYGAAGADVTTVIQAQQDLANDQGLEVQAMAAYTHAKVAFDQALGQTLDINRIKWDEALSGRVERESVIPSNVPEPRK